VQLFNATGQVVYSNEDLMFNNHYQNNINLSGFERGIYLVRLIEGKKISTEKIIIQ